MNFIHFYIFYIWGISFIYKSYGNKTYEIKKKKNFSRTHSRYRISRTGGCPDYYNEQYITHKSAVVLHREI